MTATPAELQAYPRVRMSEQEARDILPPFGPTGRQRVDALAAGLRQRGQLAEQARRDVRIAKAETRRGEALGLRDALDAAWVEAETAAGRMSADAHTNLILVPNCPTSGETVENEGETFNQEIDGLAEKLERAAAQKLRSSRMVEYLDGLPADPAGLIGAVRGKLASCSTMRVYRHWLATGDCRLAAVYSCHQDKLCPVCAAARAAKHAMRYAERVEHVVSEDPGLSEWLWTITVKDGPDLVERFNHLTNSLRRLTKRRSDVRGGKSRDLYNDFAGIAGAVYSIEVVVGRYSGEWHPHVHVYALHDTPPRSEREVLPDGRVQWRCRPFEAWWHRTTGDSFVTDVRPVVTENRAAACVEVLKYACKFSSMTLAQNVEAWQATRGRRLMSALGNLRGVKLPDNLLDEFSDDDGPWLDLAFRWDRSTESYMEKEKK